MVILQTAVEKQFGLDKRFSYIHSKRPGKKTKVQRNAENRERSGYKCSHLNTLKSGFLPYSTLCLCVIESENSYTKDI